MKTIFIFDEIANRSDLDLNSHRALWAQITRDSNAD